MPNFNNSFDFVARMLPKIFGMSEATYYYVSRANQDEPHEIKGVIEIADEIESVDQNGYPVRRKGKAFTVPPETIEKLGKNPEGRDYILRITPGNESRFEIDEQSPYNTTGPNKALYLINTVLDYDKAVPI